MRDVTHDEAHDLLAGVALDALPPDDLAAVLAHVRTCAECGLALAELRDATAQLAYAVPNVVDDPVRRARARARLLARAHADVAVAETNAGGTGLKVPAPAGDVVQAVTTPRQPDREGPGRPVATRSWVAASATAWTAAGLTALAAAGVVMTLNSRRVDAERAVAASRAADSLRIAQLEDTLSIRDSTLRDLTGKQVSILQLTAGTPRAPWAWMFWNHVTNRWTFFAHNLPPAAAGKTYQLWLVTPSAKISAGTFAPEPNGSAEVQATYALARDSLKAVAVTEEPAGGVPQPTGPFVITASAGQ
jgi:hypothetical protein